MSAIPTPQVRSYSSIQQIEMGVPSQDTPLLPAVTRNSSSNLCTRKTKIVFAKALFWITFLGTGALWVTAMSEGLGDPNRQTNWKGLGPFLGSIPTALISWKASTYAYFQAT